MSSEPSTAMAPLPWMRSDTTLMGTLCTGASLSSQEQSECPCPPDPHGER